MHLDSDFGCATWSGVYCVEEEDLSCVELVMLSEAASVFRNMFLAELAGLDQC